MDNILLSRMNRYLNKSSCRCSGCSILTVSCLQYFRLLMMLSILNVIIRLLPELEPLVRARLLIAFPPFWSENRLFFQNPPDGQEIQRIPTGSKATLKLNRIPTLSRAVRRIKLSKPGQPYIRPILLLK